MIDEQSPTVEIQPLGQWYRVLVDGKPVTGPLSMQEATKILDDYRQQSTSPRKPSFNLLFVIFVFVSLFAGLVAGMFTNDLTTAIGVAAFSLATELIVGAWVILTSNN